MPRSARWNCGVMWRERSVKSRASNNDARFFHHLFCCRPRTAAIDRTVKRPNAEPRRAMLRVLLQQPAGGKMRRTQFDKRCGFSASRRLAAAAGCLTRRPTTGSTHACVCAYLEGAHRLLQLYMARCVSA